MRALLKICFLLLLTLAFIVWMCVIWLDNVAIQLIFFGSMWLLAWLRLGLRALWRQMRLMLPILFTLMSVYLIFGLIGFRVHQYFDPAVHPLRFWLIFGAVRTLLLVNTVLWIRTLFSFVSADDVDALPIPLPRKKGLLLGRILYRIAIESVRKADFYQALIPSNQLLRLRFRQRMQNKLAIVLCLLFVVFLEAKTRGELIDNRIKHCHKGD